jgi:hypothetical protein
VTLDAESVGASSEKPCFCWENGGRERVRTADPLLAKQVLSQLSYTPPISYVHSKILPPALHTYHLETYFGIAGVGVCANVPDPFVTVPNAGYNYPLMQLQ